MQLPKTSKNSQLIEDRVTFDLAGVLAGVRKTTPVTLSIFAYGVVFGVLARQARFSLEEALLMSSLVFSGASQFVALGLWTTPLPVESIIFTTLVVNLRHVLMGAALSPIFLRLHPVAAYGTLFFMGDESWALAMNEFNRGNRNAAILLGSGLAIFIAWLSATFIGQTVGSILENPASWGLDFAFTAVFVGLLASLWKGKSDFLPWAVATVVAVAAAAWLPSKWYILLGGLMGSLVGAMQHAD